MSESNNKELPQIKIKLVRMKLWIGILVGTLLVSILFINQLNPAFDTPRIIGENAIVYNVIAGIIVGVLVGNGIKNGALSGVLAGAIVFSLVIIKELIFDSLHSTPLQYLAILVYMILMLALPMALGGVIGGLVYEIMKTALSNK